MPSSLPRFADATLPGGRAANILAAARALAPHLAAAGPWCGASSPACSTTAFGATDAEDACEAMEAATVLLVRRLAQIGRLEDAPAGILQTLADLADLAAQVRRGDEVLKPSAEIGMIAALPTTCSSAVKLNALGERRSGILDGLNSVRSSAPDGGPVDSACKRPAVP